MAAQDPYLYKDTLDLINFYNTNSKFRGQIQDLFKTSSSFKYLRINSRVRPARSYLWAIETISPRRYSLYTQRPPTADSIDFLLKQLYVDRESYKRLNNWVLGQKIDKNQGVTQPIPESQTQPLPKQVFPTNLSSIPKADITQNIAPKTFPSSPTQTPQPITQPQARFSKPHLVPISSEQNLSVSLFSRIKSLIQGTNSQIQSSDISQSLKGAGSTTLVNTQGFLSRNFSLSKIGSFFGDSFQGILGAGSGASKAANVAQFAIPGGPLARGGLMILNTPVGRAVAANAARVAFFANPLVIATVAALLLLFLTPFLLNFLQSSALCPPYAPSCAGAEAAPVSSDLLISKTGPSAVSNNQDINYEITVSYSGAGIAKIEITDKIPDDTNFKSASDNGVESSKVVKWTIDSLPSGQAKKVNLVVTPTKNDFWAINNAEAVVLGITGITVSGGNQSANSNNCGGKYTSSINSNPLKLNFGDPSCDFTPDLLLSLLRQLDPPSASKWYVIARCESSYNPNNYNPKSTSGHGAFGLFQMNPTGKGNGIYDVGDVAWQQQTSNAINYNKLIINGSFSYWQCSG